MAVNESHQTPEPKPHLLFAADLHGSPQQAERLLGLYEREKADSLVLLGDLLSGGGWNPPYGYDPRETARILNRLHTKIIAVQGNCDSQADADALAFPLEPGFATRWIDGRRWRLTHGHLYSPENPPALSAGDVLVYGHTHLFQAEIRDGIFIFNPGSITLPKKGAPPSYAVYDGRRFRVRSVDGDVLAETGM